MKQWLNGRRVALAAVAIIAIAIAGLLMMGAERDRVILTDPSTYTVTQRFSLDGTFPMKKKYIKKVKSKHENILLWGSWLESKQTQGELVSPEFTAPKFLNIYVSGYPHEEGNQILLERKDTKEKLKIDVKNIGERWERVPILLPPGWHKKTVELIAIDGSKDFWLGISSPVKVNFSTLIKNQIPFLSIVPIFLMHAALFLIPGLFLYVLAARFLSLHPCFSLISSIAMSCVVGYGTFWLYFLDHRLGLAIAILLIAGSLFSPFLLKGDFKQHLIATVRSQEFWLPLAVMLLAGLFYLAILYWPGSESLSRPEVLAGWQQHAVGSDSVIPKGFAERLYAGQDPRPMGNTWLSSDRPPLQAGLVLTQRPIVEFHRLSYQLFGTLLQCAWIAAMWALCRAIQLSGRSLAIVLGLSVLSGFFLYNSVYVWPKLLAAALAMVAIALALQAFLAKRRLTVGETVLGAGAIALGMLAHGGIIFTLPPVFLLILWPKVFPSWRSIALGMALFFCLMAPWTAYQKLYDPPGNRLVKMHLAGLLDIDSRSPVQAITEEYGKLSLPEIASYKWENAKKLVGPLSPFLHSSESWRTAEFFHVFRALNVLNVGWLVLPMVLLRKVWRKDRETRAIMLMLGIAISSTILWIALLFGPGGTVIHHGSYATMMLLFAGLGALVARLPTLLICFFVGLQAVIFAGAWLLEIPAEGSLPTAMLVPNLFMLGLGSIAGLGLVWLLMKVARSRLPQDLSAG